MKTIGLVTGGGDAPGLNAVLRAVVKTACGEFGLRVVGIEDSFEGLLGECKIRDLSPTDVRGLLPRGGTILGTRNKGRFVEYDEQGKVVMPEASYREALVNLERLGIEGLIVLGGEGSLAIANEFHRYGFPVIGVPKTIDNDLAQTELTFGFLTALDTATEALDRLHTTAESHDRVMILEVMGRHTGWIAIHSGIAGGADVILIPEIPFTIDAVCERIKQREACGSDFSIIVVAEGARQASGEQMYLERGNRTSSGRLGGIGNYLCHEIEERIGKETRAVTLGHLQRGGRPNAFDRMLATLFGAHATRALVDGKHGKMVALHASDIITVPLERAIQGIKTVPPTGTLVRTARDIGISFAAPDEAEHHIEKL